MRDERQPFRLADLRIALPLVTSLFMAVYGVLSEVDQHALPVLLSFHALFAAWASAEVSGRTASRLSVWERRHAPGLALARERRQWMQRLSWTLGFGLLGPAVLALRLAVGGMWPPALWAGSMTLLGVAIGA